MIKGLHHGIKRIVLYRFIFNGYKPIRLLKNMLVGDNKLPVDASVVYKHLAF